MSEGRKKSDHTQIMVRTLKGFVPLFVILRVTKDLSPAQPGHGSARDPSTSYGSAQDENSVVFYLVFLPSLDVQ